jgi:hypothetical protein
MTRVLLAFAFPAVQSLTVGGERERTNERSVLVTRSTSLLSEKCVYIACPNNEV